MSEKDWLVMASVQINALAAQEKALRDISVSSKMIIELFDKEIETCGNSCKESEVIEKGDFDKITSGLVIFRSLYWKYATDGALIYAEREGNCHKCANEKLALAMKKMEIRQRPNSYISLGSDHSLHVMGVDDLLSLAKIVIDYADVSPEFSERMNFNKKNSHRIKEYKTLLQAGFTHEIDIPAHNDYENRAIWTDIVKSVSDAEKMLETDEYGFPTGIKKEASKLKTKIIGSVRHLQSNGFLRKITL